MAGGAAAQPAPDCGRATGVTERAICSDPARKAADAEMAEALAALRAALPPEQYPRLLADQRRWVVERDALCRQQKSAFAACLRRETEARRGFLAGDMATSQPLAGKPITDDFDLAGLQARSVGE